MAEKYKKKQRKLKAKKQRRAERNDTSDW
jgi:hypothetical protein